MFSTAKEIPAASNQTCFGVTLVKKDIGIIDCINFVPATFHHYYNHYYVVSASKDHTIESNLIGYNYLNYMPLERKTVKYITTHDNID